VSMGSEVFSELDIVLEVDMFEWAKCGDARRDAVRLSSGRGRKYRTSAFVSFLEQKGDCYDDTPRLLYLLLHRDKHQSNDT
jgi:hypothetical protein